MQERSMRSKYESWCYHCQRQIIVNELVLWTNGKGARHQDCSRVRRKRRSDKSYYLSYYPRNKSGGRVRFNTGRL